MDITVARNIQSESSSQDDFTSLQDRIYTSFGATEPIPPALRCRNATQTSVVLEWDIISSSTADIISLSLFRNGQKAGNIPRPASVQSTKISGLAVDTEYVFHLVLRTTAGTFASDKITVRTHKMTDLSGITVTAGILPGELRESLMAAIDRIGAKTADTVRIDTTHFVTTEGRGPAWEKAMEMNIPVVRPEWVEGCERGGRIVGVRGYYLDADPKQRPVFPQADSAASLPTVAGPSNGAARTSGSHRNSVNGGSSTIESPPEPPAKDTPSRHKPAPSQRQDSIPPVPEAKEEPAEDAEAEEDKKIAMRPAKTTQQSLQDSSDVNRSPQPIGLGLEVPDLGDDRDPSHSGESTPGGFQEVAL